jgi:hypothetical protein
MTWHAVGPELSSVINLLAPTKRSSRHGLGVGFGPSQPLHCFPKQLPPPAHHALIRGSEHQTQLLLAGEGHPFAVLQNLSGEFGPLVEALALPA